MASSYTSLALSALLLMSCAASGSATLYIFDWSYNGNYTWLSGKKFVVGDLLILGYQSNQHTVTEVSASDYSSCSASNPISSTSTGQTTITLSSAGSHYYICAIPGHCANGGMKFAVNVTASTTNSPSGAAAGLVPTVSAVAAIAGLVATLF